MKYILMQNKSFYSGWYIVGVWKLCLQPAASTTQILKPEKKPQPLILNDNSLPITHNFKFLTTLPITH